MSKSWMGFAADETGAVTVDWVVLTAAIVGLGMVVLYPIAYSTENTAKTASGYVSDVPVGYKKD